MNYIRINNNKNELPKITSSDNAHKQIIFTANYPYFIHLEVVIKSIVALHRSNIDFYVIYPEEDNNNKEENYITSLQEKLSLFDNINIYGHKNVIPEHLHYADNTKTHLNKMVFLRFGIMELSFAKKLTGKALYIDIDIICTNLLDDLFTLDMLDASIGMVPEIFSNTETYHELHGEYMRHLIPYKYYNAGVILLNIDKLNANNTNWYEDIQKYNYKDFLLFDQDFFNIHYENDIYQIDDRFNYNSVASHYENMYSIRNKIHKPKIIDDKSFTEKEISLPAIIHWNGNIKPWAEDKDNFAIERIYTFYKFISFNTIAKKDEIYFYNNLIKLLNGTRIAYKLKNFQNHTKYIYLIDTLHKKINDFKEANPDVEKSLMNINFTEDEYSYTYKIGDKNIRVSCLQELKELFSYYLDKFELSNFPVLIYSKLMDKFDDNEFK